MGFLNQAIWEPFEALSGSLGVEWASGGGGRQLESQLPEFSLPRLGGGKSSGRSRRRPVGIHSSISGEGDRHRTTSFSDIRAIGAPPQDLLWNNELGNGALDMGSLQEERALAEFRAQKEVIRNLEKQAIKVKEKNWLLFAQRPSRVMADTDITDKKWAWAGRPDQCPKTTNDITGPVNHPKFLFDRPVHRVRVTLTDERKNGELLWDAVYSGGHDLHVGSEHELLSDARPDSGAASNFKYICPPFHTKAYYKLCVQDDQPGSWKECHKLMFGLARDPLPNSLLKPRFPVSSHWDGMLPVKGVGFLPGGVYTFDATIEPGSSAAAREHAHMLRHQLRKGHALQALGGEVAYGRYGRPRYPTIYQMEEDPHLMPAVPVDLFGHGINSA